MYCMTGVIIETFLLKIFNYLWYIILLEPDKECFFFFILSVVLRCQVADKTCTDALNILLNALTKNIYISKRCICDALNFSPDFTIYPLEIRFYFYIRGALVRNGCKCNVERHVFFICYLWVIDKSK